MESLPMTGSSKRAKAPGNVAQVVNCSVDGCNADLSQCREYHRRHKVCEMHSKTAKVTVGGRELRFCQQCSRFHSLAEFDDGKRSCRKRLDGHNRRRRKPQPDSLNKSSAIQQLYSSNQQGTKLLQFGGTQIYPSAVVSTAWSGVIKAENDMVLYNNQSHFNYILPESSISQPPHITPNSAPGNANSALSLLSPAPEVTRETGFSHGVHSLHYEDLSNYAFSQENECKPGVSDTGLHFHEMVQNAPDGSSPSGSHHQTLTFRWE